MQNLNKLIKILCTFLLCIVIIKAQAQTGLNFQGVARTNNNIILASQPVSLRLSILQGSATGISEYVEIRRVTTNAQGLFTAVIGDTGAISTLGNFSTINWKNTPKFLKIEMDPAAGNNFITMGTTQFQYVAYAQFAKSVDADNITGIVPVSKGGTGASSLASLKSTLALDKVNNTADTDKPISTKTQTALDLKLNAEDTSKYVKKTYADSSLLTKLRITDTAAMLSNRIGKDTLSLSNRINLKANLADFNNINTTLSSKLNLADTIKYSKQTYADSSLLTKLRITDTAAMLSNRIGKDTLNLSARINAKANNTDVTTSLALKENASNKSSAADLGGTSPSDVLFPTQKAVKDYVTANSNSGGIADGGITTIKLADGAVTDAKLGTGISKSKVGLGNVENISINTWAGTSSLTTVGTITSGTWSGTAVAVEKGGTGLTSAGTAGQVLTSTGSGTLIWKSTTPVLSIGDDYQGGKVAYILQEGDPGYDATIQKGLIAATSDQSTGIRWYNVEFTTTGTTGTAIGTGLSNTNTIINSQGATATSYAAGLARAYTGGGYTDWYLPSKDELNKLYLNKTAIGGFAVNKLWWSSTEYNNYGAYFQSFNDGYQGIYTKNATYNVRAIRAFSAVKSIEDGGTGATTASAARTNLGLVIGTNVQAPLTAGTDYLTPTGSASGLTNFPTLNQNTTGNAATASKLETARNINGVSFDGSGDIIITSAADAETLTGTTLNSTITGSSLTSVGTITSGVWSGTTLSVEKGGTGATTASAARTNLGLEIGTNVQAKLVSGTGINIDNNTNSISTIQNISITSSPTLRSLSLTNGVDPQFANNSNQIIFGWNANPFGRNNDGTIEYAHAIKTRHNSLESLGNNIDFFTWDPANNYSSTLIGNKHIMTIQGDGKVGIGKQVPLKSLDVVGDIQTTGNLIAGTVVYPNTVGSNNQVLTSFTNGTIGWSNFTQGQADAGTLTGTTLNSTITGSSLTSVGRIANLSTGAIINSGKVIVGATSAASSSAVLEASSNTQGFLPPRMSASQRNAISYPATGLIIFCNNCSINGQMQYFNGTAWVDMVGNATASVYTPTVGSSYQGGIVAYILVSGDPGYDATTTHGLIAATEDQSSGIQWCNNCSIGSTPPRTGATGSEIGSGLTNTNKIIAIQGETSTSYAAGLARAYTGGGYNDWYLPSKDELEKLYLNRALIGGFSYSYWSSTDDDDTPTSRALAQNFGTSYVFRNFYNKHNNFYVRAIRSF